MTYRDDQRYYNLCFQKFRFVSEEKGEKKKGTEAYYSAPTTWSCWTTAPKEMVEGHSHARQISWLMTGSEGIKLKFQALTPIFR